MFRPVRVKSYGILIFKGNKCAWTGLNNQGRPKSDATEHIICSGSALFGIHPAFLNTSADCKMELFLFSDNFVKLLRYQIFRVNTVLNADKPEQTVFIQTRRPDRRPRWLSWMRRPTGDQEVAGSNPAEVGNILSWRLIMKYFLRSFSPFR